MNPLLKHPLLQHLPYEQLKQPTSNGINAYLQKRKRKFYICSGVFLICGLGTLSWQETINFSSIIYPAFLFVSSVVCLREAKKSRLTDEEIVRAISGHTEYSKNNE